MLSLELSIIVNKKQSEEGEKIMTNPLAGTAGKPIVGVPGPGQTFVGRIIIELFEDARTAGDVNGQAAADAKSMALIVSPGLDSNVTKEELLQRVATAFPARAANEIRQEERKRQIAKDRGGVYE